MTKEMRPSHRVDVLSDALLHYGKKTKINLGNLLMARMKRAVDVEETAKSDIEKLCRCFPSHRISIDNIREWMKDESTFFGREVETEEEDWKCKYVIYLDLYADLYHRWNGCTDPSELTVRFNQMKKIDEQLKIMERENSISARWQNTDSEYENAKREVASRKEKRVLSRMRKNVVERWFLLNLKSKYCDGQALASRLSKQITRVTKDVNKDIAAYNEAKESHSNHSHTALTFDAVKDPDNDFGVNI
ncbi:uncharacterized protein LOC124435957 [Xenia sp. Carnegie-2017]|uniref:uncharacterized protein LOC124435957 n=1 Tax=Xenia sp. Carnegie-2017 TaxID=2897299 RepID=UPI001F0470CB|nr:uncharacterized protein LOC124435957 [Xenia sp. Carnegie-2017]